MLRKSRNYYLKTKFYTKYVVLLIVFYRKLRKEKRNGILEGILSQLRT